MNIEDRLRQEHNQWYIDITDLAIEMFGDIVDKVEITNFYDYTKEEAIEGAKVLIEKWKINLKDSGITFDGENMLVSFKNGKKIEIWNSEWGGIRFPEDNEIKLSLANRKWVILWKYLLRKIGRGNMDENKICY